MPNSPSDSGLWRDTLSDKHTPVGEIVPLEHSQRLYDDAQPMGGSRLLSPKSYSPCEPDFQSDHLNVPPVNGVDFSSSHMRPTDKGAAFNAAAVEAMKHDAVRFQEPLKGLEEVKEAKSAEDLIIKQNDDIQGQKFDGTTDEDYKALTQMFNGMDISKAHRIADSINPDLARQNLKLAPVDATGEVWIGNRSKFDETFGLGTRVRTEACEVS